MLAVRHAEKDSENKAHARTRVGIQAEVRCGRCHPQGPVGFRLHPASMLHKSAVSVHRILIALSR